MNEFLLTYGIGFWVSMPFLLVYFSFSNYRKLQSERDSRFDIIFYSTLCAIGWPILVFIVATYIITSPFIFLGKSISKVVGK